MEWINIFGLIFMAVIMLPNIIFAASVRGGFENLWKNKWVEILEQIGRYGCFIFMIVNIPGTWSGWRSDEWFAVYLLTDSALILIYLIIWVTAFRKESLFTALSLSAIPSFIFLFSGIASGSVLLTVSALLFAPSHILLSYMNQKVKEKSNG